MPTNCLNVYSQLLKKHIFTASESCRQTGSSRPCTIVTSHFCWCRFLRQSETRWRKLWPRRNYFYTLCASGLGNSHVVASWLSCSTSEVFPHHNNGAYSWQVQHWKSRNLKASDKDGALWQCLWDWHARLRSDMFGIRMRLVCVYQTLLVRPRVSEVLCFLVLKTRLLTWQHGPPLTAEVWGCYSWMPPRRINWLKSSWKRESEQSSASCHILSRIAGGNLPHTDIGRRGCLRIWPGCDCLPGTWSYSLFNLFCL